MRKNLAVILLLATFALNPAIAFAESDAVANTTSEETVTTTITPTEKVEKSTVERPIKTTGERMVNTLYKGTVMKDAMKETKDEFKDKMAAARDEFKSKMKELKDERKKKALENVDGRITELNKKKTTKLSEQLDRFTLILANISTKEATLKAAGKNTTLLAADIAAASNAIDTAKAAVTAQAAKDYVVDVTTEEELKTNASATVQQFLSDMKAVLETVRAAQKALRKAWTDAARLEGKEPTVTPTATVTVAPTEPATP